MCLTESRSLFPRLLDRIWAGSLMYITGRYGTMAMPRALLVFHKAIAISELYRLTAFCLGRCRNNIVPLRYTWDDVGISSSHCVLLGTLKNSFRPTVFCLGQFVLMCVTAFCLGRCNSYITQCQHCFPGAYPTMSQLIWSPNPVNSKTYITVIAGTL